MKTKSIFAAAALIAGASGLCWLALADVQAPNSLANLVPLRRFDQSGATDGQVPTWSAALGMWVPGAGSTNSQTVITQNVTTNNVTYLNAQQETVTNLTINGGVGNGTNKWNGATNAVDFNVYSQSFSTLTPFNFSGFVLPTNAPEAGVLIQISNISTTNVTGTWPVPCVVLVNGTLATSATVTNGTTEYFWWHYTSANNGPRTNAVAQQL